MSKIWGNVQVKNQHYFSKSYLSKARFLGLYGQVCFCQDHVKYGNILEIGPGPGLFSSVMKQLGHNLTTIDFDVNLKTDMLGKLPELPLRSGLFDIVCAFEVLEHTPFELINECLLEMARVSNSLVIISVPDVRQINPKYKINVDIKIKNWKFRKKYFKSGQNELTNPQEHYWELGIEGISEEMVIDEAKRAELELIENKFIEPWFHFFVFRKQNV